MNKQKRYQDSLSNFLPAGEGNETHTKILSVANLAVIAGVDPEQIFQDIRNNIPRGSRHIPDREILDAISKAVMDHNNGDFTPRARPRPLIDDGKATLNKLIQQSQIRDEIDLWELSPIRLWGEPSGDPVKLIETVYEPDDLLFIGDTYDHGKIGETIRPAFKWIEHFKAGGDTAAHIIVNPLNGLPMPKETGEDETLRGNKNVKAFKYCLIEFDNLTLEEQTRFWTAAKLPIKALIFTGGKSIHAWIDVQKLAPVNTLEDWQRVIKEHFFDFLLSGLKVDSACKNPARLSRLPGHFREDKGQYQKLLWLSREGQPVCKPTI